MNDGKVWYNNLIKKEHERRLSYVCEALDHR